MLYVHVHFIMLILNCLSNITKKTAMRIRVACTIPLYSAGNFRNMSRSEYAIARKRILLKYLYANILESSLFL